MLPTAGFLQYAMGSGQWAMVQYAVCSKSRDKRQDKTKSKFLPTAGGQAQNQKQELLLTVHCILTSDF
jgi:hypothetical protein